MAQWMFLSELEKARSLYLDAYFARYGHQSPKTGPTRWIDLNWLDQETERLVLGTIRHRKNFERGV
jgi:hypothetical protein